MLGHIYDLVKLPGPYEHDIPDAGGIYRVADPVLGAFFLDDGKLRRVVPMGRELGKVCAVSDRDTVNIRKVYYLFVQ